MPDDISFSSDKLPSTPATNTVPIKQMTMDKTANIVSLSLNTILPIINTIMGAR